MIANIPEDHVAELYGGEVRIASSSLQEGWELGLGGHPLHVEGGAELAWKLVADLHLLHRRLEDTIEKLRATHCPHCGGRYDQEV
jgi:hypothetical protein